MSKLIFEPIAGTDHYTLNGEGEWKLVEGCTRIYEAIHEPKSKEKTDFKNFKPTTDDHIAFVFPMPNIIRKKIRVEGPSKGADTAEDVRQSALLPFAEEIRQRGEQKYYKFGFNEKMFASKILKFYLARLEGYAVEHGKLPVESDKDFSKNTQKYIDEMKNRNEL